jgi:hypothetical protein
MHRLNEMGVSRYRIMKLMNPPTSYRTVDAWFHGEWGASKNKYLPQLQDLYNNKCRELGVGLFCAEINSNT